MVNPSDRAGTFLLNSEYTQIQITMKAKLRILVTLMIAVTGVAIGHAQTRVEISKLPGEAITSSVALTDNYDRPGSPTAEAPIPNSSQREHIYFLYNVGTGQVLHSGGSYGTSAVLSDVGHYFWIENVPTNEVSAKGGQFYFHDNLNTANDQTNLNGYLRLQVDNNGSTDPKETATHVYADHGRNQDHSGWNLQKVTTDNSSENVYLIYTNGVNGDRYYIGSAPFTVNGTSNSSRGIYSGNYVGWSTRSTSQQVNLNLLNNKDYWWKFISLSEYARLFNLTPAQMQTPLDASFLLMDPSFHVNNRYLTSWTTSANSGFRFGTEYLYKEADHKDTNEYVNYYKYDSKNNRINDANSNRVQENFGSYYYAYTHSSDAQELSQRLEVIKPGWYILSCNGFSTENYGGEGISNSVATLFAEYNNQRTTQALNGISAAESATEMAPPSVSGLTTSVRDGSGKLYYEGVKAGLDFASGKYINLVMFKVDEASETNPAWITFGINITPKTSSAKSSMRRADAASSSDSWTAFDNFRLSYAGNTASPDLVLNEDAENGLDTLLHTSDNYNYVTLHLNRKFTTGKWNTLVLPVSLNAGQLRTTFGDDVQLAYLKNLTANTMQFERVTLGTEDTGAGLQAYMPYIIKPSKEPGSTPAYTSSALTSSDENYNGKTLSVPANHYDISMVSLDNAALGRNGSTSAMVDNSTWETKWTGDGRQSSTYDNQNITAIGTMAQTWTVTRDADGKITAQTAKENRGGQAGDYYMKGGEMWRVPAKQVYPLKAFRVWFRPGTATNPQAKVSVWLDNEELTMHDNGTSTGIDDIVFTEPKGVTTTGSAFENAVYTVTGQRVRSGLSTDGLPRGMYVVDGRKILVK